MSKITILGSGAWGRALAFVFAKAGHEISSWSRKQPVLPELTDCFIAAVPAQAMHEVLSGLKPGSVPVISAAKGIERSSGRLMSEVLQSVAPQVEIYALSGPGFASDVIAGLPTAVSLAGPDLARAKFWANKLSTSHFRIYPSDDLVGVEIGGAFKNVLAIACGICEARGLGESARASLMTRGFAELLRYARARGARSETLMGLSGFGDLILTCSSAKSRNYAYGLALGQNQSPAEAMVAAGGTVEGVYSAAIAAQLARDNNIDMPIIAAVAAIVDGSSKPGDEIAKLLARPVRVE